MLFQVEFLENGGKNIFTDRLMTNNVNVTFLAVINKVIRCA